MRRVYNNRGWQPDEQFKVPTEVEDAAYIAGLMDGEGSISRSASKHHYWSLNVGMTDRDALSYLASFGGRITEHRGSGLGRRPMLSWRMGRQRHVGAFLRAIEPYMKLGYKKAKAQQAVREIQERLDI